VLRIFRHAFTLFCGNGSRRGFTLAVPPASEHQPHAQINRTTFRSPIRQKQQELRRVKVIFFYLSASRLSLPNEQEARGSLFRTFRGGAVIRPFAVLGKPDHVTLGIISEKQGRNS